MQHFTYEEKLILGKMLRDPGNLFYKMPDDYTACIDQCTIEKIEIPAPFGPVPCDIIRPKDGCTNDLLYINIHGGGFVQIHHEWDTEMCCYYAVELGLTVVDVDYHLTPEYAFPVAINDCYAVTQYCHEHAAELGVNPEKIIIGGNSAGGTLSLDVCMMAHEKSAYIPDMMIMVYPAADMGHSFKDFSFSQVKDMNLKELEVRSDLYNRLYCDDDPAAQSSPYCDFLNAPDDMFTEIPDTILVTAGKDPLHFGAEKLPPKLLISGKSLSMRQFPESQHGFYVRTIGTEWKAARDFILDRIAVHYGITRKESQKAK